MRSFITLLCGFIFSSQLCHADASGCGPKDKVIVSSDILCITQELIEADFPELKNALANDRIRFEEFESNAYFFETAIARPSIPMLGILGVYALKVNPKIFQTNESGFPPLTLYAAQGILAHELVHLLDYERMDIFELMALGVIYLFQPAKYERNTDERALQRGYASGLIEYRKWLYPRLSPDELQTKKKRYYSPEEIQTWLAEHPAKSL